MILVGPWITWLRSNLLVMSLSFFQLIFRSYIPTTVKDVCGDKIIVTAMHSISMEDVVNACLSFSLERTVAGRVNVLFMLSLP